ncbi:MAG TPA: hypothetical protein VFY53_06495, partial [Rhodoplanes sp.]|nr:hypothetical protein [Rhodoplanes sp.]
RALSGSDDYTLRLWDLVTGESRALAGHTSWVNAVAVLPDGRRALSGSDDNLFQYQTAQRVSRNGRRLH